MSMRTLLLVAVALLLIVGVMTLRRHQPLQPQPGVLAASAPAQIDLAHGAALQRGDITLTTRAHFDITARVLSREDYSFGADAELIPLDLALGWGRMSDSAVLAKIDISQSHRFYHWRVDDFPIPRREIETSSANMHMIPADPEVKRQLERVRQGEVVHIEGFLVDASRANGWHWNTSLTRNDTGGGACELIYVERIETVAVASP